ncbi:Hypothetical predicted protein [Xyrichtys novacula]|uniref:Uncharacterized protein n=1 Tax=Xyrichtys novacula TaxID=13765 RepID=A0AAV1HAE7_XYRNO|nr:Hypothetical predicted protein [Xyrichtys novacula]
MEYFELGKEAEGTPNAEQSQPPCRSKPEGFELHRVVKNMNCNCWFIIDSEANFNRQLKVVFLTLIMVALISVFLLNSILNGFFSPGMGFLVGASYSSKYDYMDTPGLS